jgi:small subunit ribosomal protein S1
VGSSDKDESFAALFESSDGAKRKKSRVKRGDRLDVKVVAITTNSVFVDLGSKEEGYFERIELLDARGNLTVEVGSVIGAVVAETDGERVKLSPVFVRQKSESVIDAGGETVSIPAGRGGPLIVEGAVVRGVVTGVERYGVFLQIEGTQGRNGRGLVPVAETGAPRGADLRKLFPEGGAHQAKILAIQEDGKIRLSMKAAREDEERRQFEEYARSGTIEPAAEGGSPAAASAGGAPAKKPPAKPGPRNLGTLGDLLSKTKGIKTNK